MNTTKQFVAFLGSCNELENPIGIETMPLHHKDAYSLMRCNELENPIGIETIMAIQKYKYRK